MQEFKLKRLHAFILVALSLLLIPFIAMQFTSEVNWTFGDFILAAVLLFGSVIVIELIFIKIKKTDKRLGIIAAVLIVLFLIWAELAVGIFGTPLAGS